MSILDLQDGSTWAAALLHDHNYKEVQNRDVAYKIARGRRFMMPESLSKLFKTLLSGTALRAVLGILTEDFIAGISLQELEQNADGACLFYVVCLLDVLKPVVESLINGSDCGQDSRRTSRQRRGCDCQRCVSVNELVLAVVSRYTVFMEALWGGLRSVFIPHIDTRATSFQETSEVALSMSLGKSLSSLHASLCAIHSMRWRFPHAKPAFRRLATLVAQLQCIIWLYSRNQHTQEFAFLGFMSIISGKDHDIRDEVVRAVVDGQAASRDYIRTTVITLLRNGPILEEFDVTKMLLESTAIFFPLQQTRIRQSADRELLWYKMAAFRRYWCMRSARDFTLGRRESLNVEDYEPSPIDEMANTICSHICNAFVSITKAEGPSSTEERPFLPELWIHEITHIFSILIIDVSYSPSVPSSHVSLVTKNFGLIVASVCNLLQYYRHHPATRYSHRWVLRYPATKRVRIFTRMLWQDTHTRLHNRPAHLDNPIDGLIIGWNQLGGALQRNENLATAEEDPPLEPLKQCGYRACGCSVFEAIHPMRVCNGCWSIAYCNGDCQKRDWHNHRAMCRRGRRTPGT